MALKFAQYEIMKAGYGFPPMLLLDDVFDKLDMTRISNLLSMVAGNEFGQIFITDSNKVRMAGIVDASRGTGPISRPLPARSRRCPEPYTHKT